MLQLLWLLALGYSSATAFHPAPSRRGILLWQVRLGVAIILHSYPKSLSYLQQCVAFWGWGMVEQP